MDDAKFMCELVENMTEDEFTNFSKTLEESLVFELENKRKESETCK